MVFECLWSSGTRGYFGFLSFLEFLPPIWGIDYFACFYEVTNSFSVIECLVPNSARYFLFFWVEHHIGAMDWCFDLNHRKTRLSILNYSKTQSKSPSIREPHSNIRLERPFTLNWNTLTWCINHIKFNLNNLPRFTLFSALHMLCLQVYLADYNSTVMLEDLGDLSNFTLIASGYYFHCISNLNMHFLQDWKAVWLALLSLPSLKLPEMKQIVEQPLKLQDKQSCDNKSYNTNPRGYQRRLLCRFNLQEKQAKFVMKLFQRSLWNCSEQSESNPNNQTLQLNKLR